MIICDLCTKEFTHQAEKIITFEGFKFMIRVDVQPLPDIKEAKAAPEHICESCKWQIIKKLCPDD
jgi:hypothetical protein